MKISIKEQYLDKFQDFIDSLPADGIQVNSINDDSISFEEAKIKVEKAINNISLSQGLDINNAFQKVSNY